MSKGSIGPHERLQDGTMITVGNKRGYVVSSEILPAVPSGTIVVHTVQLTDKIKRDYGKAWHWEPISEKPRTVNYTAIIVS